MTLRDRILNGERVTIVLGNGIEGRAYLDGQQIMFDCQSGLGAGCTEPVCFADSAYLDDHFLVGAVDA